MEKVDIEKSITYFRSLIDENGIIQFTRGYEIDYRFGYAIEDQARALIVAGKLNDRKLRDFFLHLIKTSWTVNKGVCMNRDAKGKQGSVYDDYKEASAEVLWGLAVTHKLYPEFIKSDTNFKHIISDLLRGLADSTYYRVCAYSLLAACDLGDEKYINLFADKLVTVFETNSSSDWQWFEDRLTYANSLMPWSLIKAFEITDKEVYKQVALESYKFLYGNLVIEGIPQVVGNKGWWQRGGKMPLFGQQPIDASYMCLTSFAFFDIFKESGFLDDAKLFYSWFHGNNFKKQNMIREDGACYDGLYEDGVNPNAGAESNICYLLASLQMKEKGILER